MKRLNWQILLGLGLIVLSALLYFIHFLIFRDTHHIFIYLLGDVAFVPIEVLLVTVIIHQLLNKREKQSMLEKMNMVIGAFFSEVGTQLLKILTEFDRNFDSIRDKLIVTQEWREEDFKNVLKRLNNYVYALDYEKSDLEHLRQFLLDKRMFLLRLLENPNLLEHEHFTNLLWSVFHITEELVQRKKITKLPEKDLEHLAGDIKRSYILLISQWIHYMKHLKDEYPYLFSLAVRTSPLDQLASPEVTK